MKPKLLLNDIHIGVQRSGGTTPATAMQLRAYLLESFAMMVQETPEYDLIINGDLFDAFMVPTADLLACLTILYSALSSGRRAVLIRGNHDWSKDSAKLSAFDFLCRVLSIEFPDQVVTVTEPMWVDPGIYAIPHMPNQDLFNLAIEQVPAREVGRPLLLLHANYHNGFAVESDHSLNVSEEQAKALIAKGWTLVFGHEHQARNAFHGGAVVTGNQWPSSIADCLNNPGGTKYAHVLRCSSDRNARWNIEPVHTWAAADDFAEVEWGDLATFAYTARFIRVIGKATAEQAPAVIEAIAKFRQASDAFVVSNAAQIEGVAEMADLPSSMEQLKAFDVLGYLYEQLDPEQAEVVKKLLGAADNEMKEGA